MFINREQYNRKVYPLVSEGLENVSFWNRKTFLIMEAVAEKEGTVYN